MMRTRIAIVALAGCMLLSRPPTAAADTGLRNDWRADYPDVCAPVYNLNCALCHTSAPALNAYGDDIMDFGDGPSIEGLDSDGDGYTNGQEILVDCTNPADASDHGVVPTDGATWSGIKVLFR
jgi:hypothetical protein